VARSFSPSIRKDARRLLTTISSTAQNTGSGDSQQIDALKRRLVAAIKVFKEVQGRDGSVSVDFGVKGGELDGGTISCFHSLKLITTMTFHSLCLHGHAHVCVPAGKPILYHILLAFCLTR
jgi:hypothetical protein